MIFCVSIFIVRLEPMVRKQLDENDLTTWSSHIQSSFATITRHFDYGIWNDVLQLKEHFTDMDHHMK